MKNRTQTIKRYSIVFNLHKIMRDAGGNNEKYHEIYVLEAKRQIGNALYSLARAYAESEDAPVSPMELTISQEIMFNDVRMVVELTEIEEE